MAGMKRFVTYIYAYEDKKKGNNIGFAKIEIRGEDCRIEIHLRGIYVRQSACKVYLFQEDAGDIVGHPLGEMKILNGNGDFVARVKAGKIGDSSFGINDMDGIFILSEDERIFMSRWKEGGVSDVGIDRFHVWQIAPNQETRGAEERNTQSRDNRSQAGSKMQPREAEHQTNAREREMQNARQQERPQLHAASQQSTGTQHAQTMQQPQNIQNTEQQAQHTEQQAQHTEQQKNIEEHENLHATEIPMRNIFPAYDWQAVWTALQENHTIYTPFTDREAMCIQIELKDLRELPKRYWYLGNNSFLLHGFFNYQYLVIGRTAEGRWFIGVPGIYQRQERVMAAIFGFPEFMEMRTEEENPENNEKNEPLNHMGCWYRYIEE